MATHVHLNAAETTEICSRIISLFYHAPRFSLINSASDALMSVCLAHATKVAFAEMYQNNIILFYLGSLDVNGGRVEIVHGDVRLRPDWVGERPGVLGELP